MRFAGVVSPPMIEPFQSASQLSVPKVKHRSSRLRPEPAFEKLQSCVAGAESNYSKLTADADLGSSDER